MAVGVLCVAAGQVVIGYRVSNQVSIEVKDLEKLADVIDDAVLAGGDNARVSSVYFTAEDTSVALDTARKLAVADAKHRANLYASEFSVDLGTLISMSENVAAEPYSGSGGIRPCGEPIRWPEHAVELG